MTQLRISLVCSVINIGGKISQKKIKVLSLSERKNIFNNSDYFEFELQFLIHIQVIIIHNMEIYIISWEYVT